MPYGCHEFRWTRAGGTRYIPPKDQEEVDCVITRGSRVWGIDVKASQSVATADTKGLRRLAQQAGDDFTGGIVFYSGNSVLPLCDGAFLAAPLAKLWEL